MARKRTLMEFLYANELKRDPTTPARGKKRKSEVEKLLQSQGLPDQTIRERLQDAGLSPSLAVKDTDNDAVPKTVGDLTGAECMNDNQLSSTNHVKPFPFFRLPPELRNKVYNYAIGGHIIRIDCYPDRRYTKGGKKTRISKVHDSTMNYHCIFSLKEPSMLPKDPKNYPTMLYNKYGVPTNWSEVHPQGVSRILNLTRVCRQMKTETALLPYTKNIYSANDYIVESPISAMIREWTYAQRTALTEISLSARCIEDLVNGYGNEQLFTLPFRKSFPGLRRVYVRPPTYRRNGVPCDLSPTQYRERCSSRLQKSAAKMRSRGDGEDEGLELVIMDPMDLSVSIKDPEVIKVKV